MTFIIFGKKYLFIRKKFFKYNNDLNVVIDIEVVIENIRMQGVPQLVRQFLTRIPVEIRSLFLKKKN